jgi:hypothetical protein
VNWLKEHADVLQAVASVFQTVLGSLAILLSVIAISISVSAQAENSELLIEAAAREDWSSYMDSAMEHPEFSFGFEAEETPENRKRYDWYVSNMLFRAETVLRSSYDSEWRDGIVRQLRFHKDFLCADDMREPLADYAENLRSLVSEVCSEMPNA